MPSAIGEAQALRAAKRSARFLGVRVSTETSFALFMGPGLRCARVVDWDTDTWGPAPIGLPMAEAFPDPSLGPLIVAMRASYCDGKVREMDLPTGLLTIVPYVVDGRIRGIGNRHEPRPGPCVRVRAAFARSPRRAARSLEPSPG